MKINEMRRKVLDLQKQIEHEYESLTNDDTNLLKAVKDLESLFASLTDLEREEAALLMLKNRGGSVDARAFAATFGLSQSKLAQCEDELISLVLDETVGLTTRHFLFHQISRFAFLNGTKGGYKNRQREAFKSMVDCYAKDINAALELKTVENLNKNMVVILTTQFLDISHGPTQTTLFICDALGNMGKDVFIINTNSFPTRVTCHTYHPAVFTCEEDFRTPGKRFIFENNSVTVTSINSSDTEIRYKEKDYPFYQFQDQLNIAEASGIIRGLIATGPGLVISVGAADLFAEAVARYLPTVSMPCNFIVPMCIYPYAAVNVPLTQEVIENAEEMGYKREKLIQSSLPYMLRERISSSNAAPLAIAPDEIAVALLGARLDDEVDEECVAMMEHLLNKFPKIRYIFIGYYFNEELLAEKSPGIARASLFLGYRTDVYSILEQCRFFLNPPRQGGGFSGLEALSVGTLVMTLPLGDVSHVVGEDFQFANVEAMAEYIRKVLADPTFEKAEKEKAHKRVAEVVDYEPIVQTLVADMERKRG